MKVLHMIFEGYTPLQGNLVSLEGWYGFRKRSLLTEILPKYERWSKIYCNNFSLGVLSNLDILNNRGAVWNRLAEQNISSFNVIHRLFSNSEFCINVYPDKAQVISFQMDLDVKMRKALWHGTNNAIGLPEYEEFSAFYEMSCKSFGEFNLVMNMIFNTAISDTVCDKSFPSKTIKVILDEIHDAALSLVKEATAKGIQIYNRLLEDYRNEQYVTVAMPESESMYLFCKPYIDLQEEYKKYFQTILDMFIKKINPDVVLIHGTQEMKSVADSESKNKIIFNYNGSTYEAIKPEAQLSIVYEEPDTHASLNVYMKNVELWKILDRYFAEFCYIKGTVHEKVYKFVTERLKGFWESNR